MEQNKNLPNPISNETQDEDEAAELQAFIERLNAVPGMVKTRSHLLEEHFESGNKDALNDVIDEIASDIAAKVPEFTSNAEKLKYLQSFQRKDEGAITVLKARQKELFQYYRSIAISEAGLPDDLAFSKIGLAKDTVAQLLNEAYPENTYTPNDALETLGIISYDENNQKIYSFPEALVPESTNDKWKTYLAAVCKHVKASDDVRTTGDKDAVEQADKTRTYAHNAATKELHAILGLEENNKKWTFADTRALLGKIRDQVLPTHDAAVSDASKKLIEEQTARLIASADLSSH
jgi:hypothetical protein